MTATFEGWAILEIMGHRKLAGYVSEATVAGVAMLRIDVPQGDKTVTQFYAAASPRRKSSCGSGGNRGRVLTHIWYWRCRLPGRKGHPCRVLARGQMNSILVEFEDGYRVVTSRYAVRLAR